MKSQSDALPELKGSILLVCSGNICRSPVAAALLQTALRPLPVEVQSAGLIAREGKTLQPEMASALGARADAPELAHFRSRRVTADMLRESDLVLTATRSQRADVVRDTPSAVRTTFTMLEFAALATDVASMLDRTGEPRPHTVADFVALIPRVRGTRALRGTLDIDDPMGRSSRVHSKVALQIEHCVGEIAKALRA